jgi:hypothetical protein
LNPFEENILGDILVPMDAIDDADQIDAHSTPPRYAHDDSLPAGGVHGPCGAERAAIADCANQ